MLKGEPSSPVLLLPNHAIRQLHCDRGRVEGMLLCIICTALLLVVCFARSFSHIIVATIAKCTYIRTNVGIHILYMLKKLLM